MLCTPTECDSELISEPRKLKGVFSMASYSCNSYMHSHPGLSQFSFILLVKMIT